ncbi:MAG: GAF domain-containing protein [Alphaproteobacteria bacterium]|nr:GAF domain-containing protein [Alphaproteobacteria bacterium]
MTGATLTSVYFASSRAAEDTAANLFGEMARRTSEQVDRQIGETLSLAALGGARPVGDSVTGDGTAFPALPFLVQALEDNAALYSLYFGFQDGSFLQVIKTRSDPRVIEALKAPAETAWVVRAITGTEAARQQSWTFLDAGAVKLGATLEPQPSYDPRARPWYGQAMASEGASLSAPYIFSSLKEPGITASRKLPGGVGVFGVDITLTGLGRFVESLAVSPRGGVVMADGGKLLAAAHTVRVGDTASSLLQPLAESGSPLLAAIAGRPMTEGLERLDIAGEEWLVRQDVWNGPGGRTIQISVAAPATDFAGHIQEMQRHVLMLALGALAVIVPLALWFSSSMAKVVRELAADAERIQNMDFSDDEAHDSHIQEFHQLGEAFRQMKATLSAKTDALAFAQDKLARIIDLGIAMSAERDTSKLMDMILLGAKDLTNADGGTLYIRSDDDKLNFQILRNDTLGVALGGEGRPAPTIPPVPMFDESGQPNHRNVVSHAVHQQETINIPDAYDAGQFDFSGTRIFDERNHYRSKSFMTVPLKPRGGDVIGALQLINARPQGSSEIIPFAADIQRFIEALAAQAATALYNRELLLAQERLMDSMIQLIAGAIDAKSPYTGGHCERVPELSVMLAEKACEVKDGPLADFAFTTDEEWREFRIGAWLHDCGKVTTPEYVVDKATKLETIYNRIHEVRTRFEVLLRDAEIQRLRSIASGMNPAEAGSRMAGRKAQLLDDFAFVAECNVGGEFMAPEKVERLKRIAGYTWWRHFDDRLGLSHEELKRYPAEASPLPMEEKLLSDKEHHIIPRAAAVKDLYQGCGFQAQVPENLYNLGEVYNLSVGRGTLTEEERFKINEHIMQTIVMLERLPFPKHLKRVPEYAGTHHETMIGSGYPRKLTQDHLSIPARITAIADIFEALTASDRPYKKAKTLSESVKILSFFKKDGHIDADLFDLFLTSGVYRDYAERFLLPEQIDEVEIEKFITQTAA